MEVTVEHPLSGFLFDSYLIMDIIFKFYIETCLVIFHELKEKNRFAACCVNRTKEQLQR